MIYARIWYNNEWQALYYPWGTVKLSRGATIFVSNHHLPSEESKQLRGGWWEATKGSKAKDSD